jgi:uncharacterized damage-inducible protein DinB
MNSYAAAPSPREIDMMRHQTQMVQTVVHMNVDGLTQEETLVQPQPGGNCLNWVVGHLLAVYHQVLPLLEQEPVLPTSVLQRYARGSVPIRNPADAVDISALMTAWDECCKRVDAGLAALPILKLATPAPMSPTNNPDETIGSLLNTVCWHQAYHSGQTGILRRLAGKPGAIK